MRVPRTRGALSGTLLVLLGLWGGLIPFVGPYFDFGYTPDEPWHVTGTRLLLSVAPAVATVLGGLIVLTGANRAVTVFGAWLAVLGGAWFVVGGPLSTLWNAQGYGAPPGGEGRQVAEQLSFFSGLGAAVVFFGALALGRFSVVGVREARMAERTAEHDAHRERGPFEPPAAQGPDVPPPPPGPQGRYARRPDQTPPPAEFADHRASHRPADHGRA
jgi:hypothetical protein